MDPDTTLAIIRDAIKQGNDMSRSLAHRNINFEEAAKQFEDLDRWLTNGGFFPTDWSI